MILEPTHKIEGFRGVNNVQDPNRLQVDKDGLVYLTSADNANITDGHRIVRRNGYESIYAGGSGIHSLYANEETCLFVSGTVMYSFSVHNTATSILTGLNANLRMNYEDVGGIIYYTNGVHIGYVLNNTANSLYAPTQTFKKVMPAGTQIAYYNGRLYVAMRNILYVSDPYQLHQYDERTGFVLFPDNIHIMKATNDAIWVGTASHVYCLLGGSPEDFIMNTKTDYGAVENSAVVTAATNVGVEADGLIVMFFTERGFCIGLPGGLFQNVTDNTFRLTLDVQNASAYVNVEDDMHQYILLTQEYTTDVSGRLTGVLPFPTTDVEDNPYTLPELTISMSGTTA